MYLCEYVPHVLADALGGQRTLDTLEPELQKTVRYQMQVL